MLPLLLTGLDLYKEMQKQSLLEYYKDDIKKNNNSLIDKNVFYFNIAKPSKQLQIIEKLELSNNVVKMNTMEVILNLPELFFQHFNIEDTYETSCGTALLEYQTKSINFTIEVGESSFGYFGEINGNYIVIQENIIFSRDKEIQSKIFGELNKNFIQLIDIYAYTTTNS